MTLFEAKRTWLFARRLADVYRGGTLFERGRDQADQYNKILDQIDRVIQNDKDQTESVESEGMKNDPQMIAASTIAATTFIEEFEDTRLFGGSATSMMSLNLAKGKAASRENGWFDGHNAR